MSVSGIERMNIAALSDEDLIRLRGVMIIGIEVDTDSAKIAHARELMAAIDDEFLLRGRES